MHILKKLIKIQFSPGVLFVHGLCILPAFLLQEVLFIRVFQTVIFIILTFFLPGTAAKKRKHLMFSLITFVFILVFNVFTPHGEVLYRLFSFPVTWGAIRTGIFKGTVFTGLLSLSKITVMKNLTLTGSAGKMIGMVFYYFQKLNEIQGKYKTKNIIKRIDSILLDISTSRGSGNPVLKAKKRKTSGAGISLIILSVLFHWGLMIFSTW